MRKTEKFDSAPAREYLAPSTPYEGQVSSEKGRWNPLWCIITTAAVQAEIKDQIKFQAAGTSIRSPAEVRERNFSSLRSPKIG